MKATDTNDWDRVREIFDQALLQPVEERLRFVRTACDQDDSLRTEIESLLRSLDSAGNFLETPAVIQVTEASLNSDQRLSDGELILHYEIRKLLGSGGMGEVYLARDTRLNRNVAIKLLRDTFLPDREASLRLLREARAAALLEHPNICQIYEISETADHSFIVMQYVVGRTLAEVIADARVSATEAIDVAIQIVDGLAEAHCQGIVHRDIKPANVIVNEKGQVKILDFGLAKFIEAETKTETEHRLNTSGSVMGTVPYMSPEQLKGNPVDARTDIFSVGSLLYEVLTGRPAFTRDNNAETISAILKEEPDWSAVPQKLESILKRCLAKDVVQRYPTAETLLSDLQEAKLIGIEQESERETGAITNEQRTVNESTTGKRRLYFWQGSDEHVENGNVAQEKLSRSLFLNFWRVGASTIILAVVTVAVIWLSQTTKSESPIYDTLKAGRLVAWKSGASTSLTDFRLSHSGKTIAYSSSQRGGSESIYIKQTSGGEEIQVTKDEWTNVGPLWSPDDQRIAYVSVRENQPGIYMTPTFGGTVTPLATNAGANISLRHWSRSGEAIYFEQAGNLYRIEVGTGEITKLTHLPDTPNNTRYFSLSSDEKSLVYADIRDGQKDLWKMSLESSEPVRITHDRNAELRPRWHPDGEHVLYNVFVNDLPQIFQTTTDGTTAPIQLTQGDRKYVLIGISADGDRLYYSNTETKSDIGSVSLDSGRENEIAAEPDLEYWSAISPDGKSLVYQSTPPDAKMYNSTFVIRSEDGKKIELSAKGFDARWLPDGRGLQIFRLNESSGEYEAWVIDSVTGEEHRITNENVMTAAWTPMPIMRVELGVLDFSPDGKRFVYLGSRAPQNAKVGSHDTYDITALTKNENINVTYFSPKFSPDGLLIALVSIEEFADKTQKAVRRLHIFGGDRERVIYKTTNVVRMVGWTTNSTLVLATAGQGSPASPGFVDIVAVAADGESRKLVTLSEAYLRTVNLFPNSHEIAYVAVNEARENIWRVSLTAGAKPKQITFNSGTRLFLANLVLSPDGNTIFFDKQEEVNTISMYENTN